MRIKNYAKILIGVFCLMFFVVGSVCAKSKVLFIDSYHEGYAWSDGITEGVNIILGDDVELKVHRMDTKRNLDEEFKIAAALKAKAIIESFKPDVVIAADDNASKYLIVPFYMDSELPFVFCGLNWDASAYGFPIKNVTGMVEVAPIEGLIEKMKSISNGEKLGILGPDLLTAQKEIANYKKIFGLEFDSYLAKDYEDYKKGFLKLQDNVDLLILLSDGGLYDDNEADLIDFFMKNTKDVTGSVYDFMAKKAVISFAKVAQEQGGWAAQSALDIINGKLPSDIPIVKNKKGKLIINVKLAEAAGIAVPFDIIEIANEVIE